MEAWEANQSENFHFHQLAPEGFSGPAQVLGLLVTKHLPVGCRGPPAALGEGLQESSLPVPWLAAFDFLSCGELA